MFSYNITPNIFFISSTNKKFFKNFKHFLVIVDLKQSNDSRRKQNQKQKSIQHQQNASTKQRFQNFQSHIYRNDQLN